MGLDRHIQRDKNGTHGTLGTLVTQERDADRGKDQESLVALDQGNN